MMALKNCMLLIPSEAAHCIARGMQTARFQLSNKTRIVSAEDAYLASHFQPD